MFKARLKDPRNRAQRRHEKDRPVHFPASALPAWRAFIELSAGRTSNGFGPNPLTWSDMRAWAEMLGEGPEPWEVHLVRSFDSEWLKAVQPKPDPKPEARGSRNGRR